MAALPAAWGLKHINMSEEVGSKERALMNGDEEGEMKGKVGISKLKWDYKGIIEIRKKYLS